MQPVRVNGRWLIYRTPGNRRATKLRVHIMVHAAGIAGRGGLRHLLGFLPALDRELVAAFDAAGPRGTRATIVVRKKVAAALPELSTHTRLVVVPDRVASSAAARLVLDQAWLPTLARRDAADCLVSLANFGPFVTRLPHLAFQTNARYFDPAALAGLHGTEPMRVALRRAAAARTMRSATRIVTPSQAMANLLAGWYPDLASRLTVLHHGIRATEFEVARGEPRAPFRFLCPGVAASYKGLGVLVTAVDSLRELDIRVSAHGNRDDWPSGIDQALTSMRRLGLSSKLTIEPEVPLEAMPSAYENSDALVYPTCCESFGFALLEALASGLPIVASDIAVNREIAGDAALYCKPHDSHDLARAMRAVASDAGLRTDLKRRARRRLEGLDFSWETHARGFLRICREAVAPLAAPGSHC